jgi:hypothetical protein
VPSEDTAGERSSAVVSSLYLSISIYLYLSLFISISPFQLPLPRPGALLSYMCCFPLCAALDLAPPSLVSCPRSSPRLCCRYAIHMCSQWLLHLQHALPRRGAERILQVADRARRVPRRVCEVGDGKVVCHAVQRVTCRHVVPPRMSPSLSWRRLTICPLVTVTAADAHLRHSTLRGGPVVAHDARVPALQRLPLAQRPRQQVVDHTGTVASVRARRPCIA